MKKSLRKVSKRKNRKIAFKPLGLGGLAWIKFGTINSNTDH